MDKLLAILLLVAVGCVGCDDRTIYLYSDAAIDAGLGADAETGEAAEDEQEVFITGVGSGGGFAGGAGGTITISDGGVADGGVADGGEDPSPAFSVAYPGFIEGVWQMTRQMFLYECDGVTIDEAANPASLEPQIYDVRFDADHRMYGCGDLTCLLWDPGWFDGDVWHPDEKPSSQQTWRSIEIVAVDENALTGRAMIGDSGGGCSGENHFSLDLSRL